MSYKERYHFWKSDDFFDLAIRNELNALDIEKDNKEI